MRANLARLRPNLTFFNDQQQQQKLQPALLASFLSLSYTRLWTCKVRTEENKNSLCYGGKSPKLYCNHPVFSVGVVTFIQSGSTKPIFHPDHPSGCMAVTRGSMQIENCLVQWANCLYSRVFIRFPASRFNMIIV